MNTHNNQQIQQQRQQIQTAQKKGTLHTLAAYTRLSGPGWLQSAITLGGGSLSSSLYLGILAGYGMLWVQPLAMLLGIIMLSGIAYVTLTTQQPPFRAIRDHINPVLAWAWILATLAANIVWSLPQFALANSVIQQNLLPNLLGADQAKPINCALILILTTAVTWCYGSGNRGIKIYEQTLKIIVAIIVLSFIGVVLKITLTPNAQLSWTQILNGFIPDLTRLTEPAQNFLPLLQQLPETTRHFWTNHIINQQRQVIISAAATAVGINMTFLLGYSLLAKKWDKHFRGLATFDLATAMLIPFILATSCVVIAAANQFHLQPAPGLLPQTNPNTPNQTPHPKTLTQYNNLLLKRIQPTLTTPQKDAIKHKNPKTRQQNIHNLIQTKIQTNQITQPEQHLAATLIKRDVQQLALSLQPLTGKNIANLIFGLGVLAMALSTITILMLISGFAICEILNKPPTGWPFKLATLAAATGILGPFIWKDAAPYLAIPTSTFGITLLPIAYISFLLLINQKTLLKQHLPTGANRILWNTLLTIATLTATLASLHTIHKEAGPIGWIALTLLLLAALAAHIHKKTKKPTPNQNPTNQPKPTT